VRGFCLVLLISASAWFGYLVGSVWGELSYWWRVLVLSSIVYLLSLTAFFFWSAVKRDC